MVTVPLPTAIVVLVLTTMLVWVWHAPANTATALGTVSVMTSHALPNTINGIVDVGSHAGFAALRMLQFPSGEHPLFLVHLPKCAGTSLRASLFGLVEDARGTSELKSKSTTGADDNNRIVKTGGTLLAFKHTCLFCCPACWQLLLHCHCHTPGRK